MTKTSNFKNPVEDFSLFANILRNSGYKSVAYAASEIIDNSIDAGASNVLILFESEGSKIKDIGFFDNGTGMDVDTLWKSVTVGGRFEELTTKGVGKRGKYGFGLPGASAAYSEIVEVYTWGKKTDNKIYKVTSDLNKYSEGIERPVQVENLPGYFEKLRSSSLLLKSNNEILLDKVNFEKSGTLVVWKGCERIKPVTTKILVERYLKPEISRIFRHFITKDNFSRKFANNLNITFLYDVEKGKKVQAYNLIPNDPLFLMEDSEFTKNTSLTFDLQKGSKTIVINGAEITIRYSLASKDLRLQYNQNKSKVFAPLTGISGVREGREIDLSDFGYFDKLEQRNRFWGCEIFFDRKADELFRVPANKQYLEALKEHLESESDDYPDGTPLEAMPIWLALDREFAIKTTLSAFLKQIKSYASKNNISNDSDEKNDNSDEDGGNDLSDDPSDDESESTSGNNRLSDDAIRNIKDELLKIGIDNPSQGQIERFQNHKVVLSYLPRGEQSGFISVSLDYGVCHLIINTESKFYKYVLSELKERSSEPGIEEAFRGIELLLLAYARSMDLQRNYETSSEFPRVLRTWSNKVEELLEKHFELE